MLLEVDVNDARANVMLDYLNVFKKDNIIKDYSIKFNDYEKEIKNDLQNISSTIADAKLGKGENTGLSLTIN